jgi:hypothetical protein
MLTAGAWYPITMEYAQSWGEKYVTLCWVLFEYNDPDKIRETWVIVPEDCLSPEWLIPRVSEALSRPVSSARERASVLL